MKFVEILSGSIYSTEEVFFMNYNACCAAKDYLRQIHCTTEDLIYETEKLQKKLSSTYKIPSLEKGTGYAICFEQYNSCIRESHAGSFWVQRGRPCFSRSWKAGEYK